MLPLLTLLTALLAPTALALNWGDQCSVDGYCDSTSRCADVGGYSYPGACPDLPDDIRCCTKWGCMHPSACPVGVEYGQCPGGWDSVYCPGYRAWCGPPEICVPTNGNEATVLDGFCPGGEDNKLCRFKFSG
ncbi:uncharacterized protein LOC62_06G007937 [Vanrija pseudolonga]|uniref:Uncharacterized protein n=1 Tax=Vanrija pseudolonga TaxID=143232 RepID=A0AAF1BT79_9TREE|nr:hypothetical protein LOC62_06G007937 [Vanrija pseudolonga]